MIDSIEKPKIPTKYAYVLKTKQLEGMLADNDIHIPVDLIYWTPQEIGSIFDVHFWPSNANVNYDRLYIRAGALLKEDVFIAREKMVEVVFPQFVVWIKNILSLPSNSPQHGNKRYFNAVFQDNEIVIRS